MSHEIHHSRPTLTAADVATLTSTLQTEMIAAGDVTRAFERAVAARLGAASALSAPSGTDALIAALLAIEIAPGDEVLMPTYVCDAVHAAIRAVGATPVLCDVAADRCVGPDQIAPRLTPRSKAVIVVHTFGAVADVDAIKPLGLRIIEDCCQCFGGVTGPTRAGMSGDACVLSFHATKLLTTGEGGMALSANPAVAARLETLRRTRQPLNGSRVTPLSDLQSALGLSQLSRYDSFLARRRSIADFYFSELDTAQVTLPHDTRSRSIFFRFPLRSSLPFESVRQAFAADGIHVRRGVDRLLHPESGGGAFPTAERLFAETVCLPIYPSLSDEDTGRIVDSARRIFGTHG
jgi:UDP-4-amino-4-deoxy-L-arabinose-oxoglutarate aminotransferase